MGIIQRQALRNTIIGFAGAIIGGTVRILTPLFVTSNAVVGVMSLLDTISNLFLSVCNLGYTQILVRLFPKYRSDERGHHGFLLLGIGLSLLGIALSFIIYYFFGHLMAKSDTDIALFQKFGFLVFPMIFFRIIFYNIDGYVKMLYNTFIGAFLDTFLSKVIMALALMLFVFAWISMDYFIYLYALTFCIPGFLIMIFAFFKTQKLVIPSAELTAPQERKKIYSYITYGMLAGASSSIVLYADTLMLARMESFNQAGIYSVLFFAARFILIPSTSLIRIATVVISEAWQRNDLNTVADIYRKSCVNQLLIAVFLLGLGWITINPVFGMHPKYVEYIPYSYLFLVIGLGIVIEMATGVNVVIISSSSHYRYNMYYNLMMALIVVVLNYFMINAFGLPGAAWALVITMAAVNFARWLLLYRLYKLQPFDLNFVKALAFCAVYMTVCYFLDYEANPWLKMAINITLLTVAFWGVVVWLKLSADINGWLQKMRGKFLKKA